MSIYWKFVLCAGLMAFVLAGCDEGTTSVEPLKATPGEGMKREAALPLPLGTVCRVTGVFVAGSDQAKATSGTLLMRIETVDGKRQDRPVELAYRRHNDDSLSREAVGMRFDCIAYESGGYVGIPSEAFRYVPASSSTDHHFETWLVVLKKAQ